MGQKSDSAGETDARNSSFLKEIQLSSLFFIFFRIYSVQGLPDLNATTINYHSFIFSTLRSKKDGGIIISKCER